LSGAIADLRSLTPNGSATILYALHPVGKALLVILSNQLKLNRCVTIKGQDSWPIPSDVLGVLVVF